jgi:hypothetical protein
LLNCSIIDTNMQEYIISVTGHRELSHDEMFVAAEFKRYIDILHEIYPNKQLVVQTGMALGFDLCIAEFCLSNGIPYIACLPFASHLAGNEIFELLKSQARKVQVISEGEYSKDKYIIRDDYLAKSCGEMYAYLIKPGPSGTRTTVNFAKKYGKRVTYFQDLEYEEF